MDKCPATGVPLKFCTCAHHGTPLGILGLPPGASADDIQTRWRQLRSELHPDHGGDAEKFHQASEAYAAAIFDARQPRPCQACGGNGSLKVVNGFHTTKLSCEACGGSGEAV